MCVLVESLVAIGPFYSIPKAGYYWGAAVVKVEPAGMGCNSKMVLKRDFNLVDITDKWVKRLGLAYQNREDKNNGKH